MVVKDLLEMIKLEIHINIYTGMGFFWQHFMGRERERKELKKQRQKEKER
jgi:hypothetical protein